MEIIAICVLGLAVIGLIIWVAKVNGRYKLYKSKYANERTQRLNTEQAIRDLEKEKADREKYLQGVIQLQRDSLLERNIDLVLEEDTPWGRE